MPISIDALNVSSLKLLARDLGVLLPVGKEKAALVASLTKYFAEHNLNVADISSALQKAATSDTTDPAVAEDAQFLTPATPSVIHLTPPPHFNVREEDRALRFEMWLEEFEAYLDAVGELNDQRSKAIFLYCVGPELKRIVEVRRYKDVSYEQLLKLVRENFLSPSTIAFNRYKLAETRQHSGESTSDYVSRLRVQARFCHLQCPMCEASLEDGRLYDVVLSNTSLTQLRVKAFEKGITTLDELLSTARSLENATQHSREMSKCSPAVVSATFRAKHPVVSLKNQVKERDQELPMIRCKFCDRRHKRDKRECPAYEQTCSNCGRKGHFAACCNQSTRKAARPSYKKLPVAQSVSTVGHAFGSGGNQKYATLLVGGVPRKFLIDTGASDNFVPQDYVRSSENLRPCPPVRCYGGSFIQPLGRTELSVKTLSGETINMTVSVVENGQALLGLHQSLDLGYVTFSEQLGQVSSLHHDNQEATQLLNEYSKLFQPDLGCVRGVKAHIQIKANSTPQFRRHRPVPLAIREKVEAEIDSMIERGVVSVVKTSQWSSPMVTVAKPNGKVRLCADYTTTLTDVVDTEAYPLPRPEELFSALSGNSVFSKLDLRTCFEQFELSEESKTILTVNTIKGLLRYNRLPYGISSAPAIVQRAMEELLRNLDVQIYIDDIMIASPDLKSHLKTLENVFKRLAKANVRLNFEKCEIAKPRIKYLGFFVSKEGISPDPDKVRAINMISIPCNIGELRSFLGLVRFYDKFIPSMSDLAKPLYDLLRNNAKWKWNSEEHNSFCKIKQTLVSAPCLQHYNPSLPIVLATDASPVGISAVLSHRDANGNEHPVAFASRSLSVTEMRYAQIDREALAIIYGVKKFSQYLLGRHFILVTDHRPLQAIFGNKKGLPGVTTARLYRYSVFLSSYNFSIEYRPGEKNLNADALSRAPVDSPTELYDATEQFLLSYLEESKLDSDEIISGSLVDPTLSAVLQFVRSGWPNAPPDNLKPYYIKRHELSVHNDKLLWGHRICVPANLRHKVLQELHATHPGVVKMKSMARQYVWWPSLSDAIEEFVRSCDTCQTYAAAPPSQPIKPWPAADVWERIHLDYCTFNEKNYLVLIDAGSKWLEAKLMPSTTSQSTLRTLYNWFTIYGFPVSIHTDGGPQFTSQEFRSKLKEWNVKHTVSPPYSPASNGAAERAVQIIKNGLRKRIPLEQFLFAYRTTPLNDGQTSPGHLMFGRMMRTRLSGLLSDAKQPGSPSRYSPGELVRVRDFRHRAEKWQVATFMEQRGRSVVLVKTHEGKVLTRHLNQIKRV